MTSNIREFTLDVSRYAEEEVPRIVKTVQQKIAMEALRGVVMTTPVDTGRARGNWQTTLGSPATDWTETMDAGGNLTISNGSTVIAQITPFGQIWLANNLPYIERLEDGHSQQAPNGMVSVTMARLEAMFARVEE